MEQYKILGILIRDRIKESNKTQILLSKYAYIIKSRLGFHEVSENTCSRIGLIILQLQGNPNDWQKFEQDLSEVGGIEVKDMTFNL